MKLRLQAKYTLMLGGMALAVSLALIFLFVIVTQRTADELNRASIDAATVARERQTERKGRELVDMLTGALAHHLTFDNRNLVTKTVLRTLKMQDVNSIRVYDANGIIIEDGTPSHANVGREAPLPVLTQVLGRREINIVQNQDFTIISAPILNGDQLLGAISLRLSHENFRLELAERRVMLDTLADANYNKVLGYILLFLIAVTLCAVAVGTLTARRMSQPIEILHRAVSRIAAGKFEIVWPTRRNDEIGELADGLKKMVHQLRTQTVSMTYLDDIISSMFDCLVVTDSRQRIEKVNAATCRLTGYSPHDLINQPFAKLLMPPGNQLLPIGEQFDPGNLKPTGDGLEINTIFAKSGQEIPIQMGVTVMASHVDGKPRMVCMFRDVSEQQKRERELRHAKDEAEIANASKSQFLANMSHELRTPLNAVIGFSSMLKDEIKGPLTSTYKSYATDIHDSAQHLLAIINDILDLSKLEAGKMDIFDEDVTIEEVVHSTIRLVKTRADERQIKLEIDLPTDLPDILADQRMLKQVLINLLSNAVKFNVPGGRVCVSARLRLDGALAIAVADSGIGMDPDTIPRLLEPFSQADAAFNRTYAGTGLGLAITKSMVELHGGQLTVDSAVGEGTTITIILPPERVAHDPASNPGGQSTTQNSGA
ncbi:ATP-binding protein [Govanella unica]|uniref:histidine kinase n=1 Tax=Govanella unica TaxID=2975056 RepID=A0A9X3U0B9_9PROT|nr:ATP-binding protein [Govania unica]MDA5195059.1 ATP-binding protein [Govania unica]